MYSELYTNGNGETETGALPSTDETSPFLPDGATVIESDLSEGVTIKDANNNEWVWIVVPKSVTASATDDDQIRDALISYATDYRRSYSDTWYEGCGLSQSEYEENYSKMLQSIKTYGGFYIGKYEVGIKEDAYRDFGSDYETEHPTTETAVIQQNKYPYNWVTCSQAEDLAEGLATGGKTSTLMFGIQWDLVLTYLETSGVLTYDDLVDDSGSWGNYADVQFPVSQGNKYAILDQSTYELSDWKFIQESYSKPNSGTESMVLLSTGATERNSKMNIYDLAGNVAEWTLEKTTRTSKPCAGRGGNYDGVGSDDPASYRVYVSTSYSGDYIGFRPALIFFWIIYFKEYIQ